MPDVDVPEARAFYNEVVTPQSDEPSNDATS